MLAELFNDANHALSEGVFTTTSVMGYSITKSLFLYSAFLVFALGLSFILARRYKNLNPEAKPVAPLRIPKLAVKEYVFLAVVIIAVAASNLTLGEKTFNTHTYYTEEFYNLAAMNELKSSSFSIIYPYSAGNLLVGTWLQKTAVPLIYYKIFLNALALALIYYCLAVFVEKIRYRIIFTLWLAALFVWALIGPTLHANVLRLFMPALSAVLLFHSANGSSSKKRLAALTAVCTGVLFFGAADSIAVFLVLYAAFTLYQWCRSGAVKEKLVFAAAPVLAVIIMFVLFGLKYSAIASNQLRSISFYSGHPNAAPYFNLFEVFHSTGIGDVLKNGLYTLIFYLPYIAMFGLIFFVVLAWNKKEERLSEGFAIVSLLLFTYLLYYRQNFGNAGPGRVVAASTVLFFLLLAVRKYYQPGALQKAIFAVSLVLYTVCTLVGFYFLRYSIIYLYEAHQNRSQANGLVECSATTFGKELVFAGFTHCDSALVEKLAVIKSMLKDETFYVYDDTFGLYYLFGKRPLVLMPSLYMGYTNEALLTAKIASEQAKYLIYPRELHYFGVPKEYLHDSRFMRVINEYRNKHFKKTFESPEFEIFELVN